MKPSTFYGNNIETFYCNQHGALFIVASVDFHRENQFERLDELPENAVELSALQVAQAFIELPEGIEEVTR